MNKRLIRCGVSMWMGQNGKKKRLCEGRLLCHLRLHSESLRFMNGS